MHFAPMVYVYFQLGDGLKFKIKDFFLVE